MPNNHLTFFVSTDAHDRILRKLWRKVGKCQGSVLMLSFTTGILFAMVIEQKQRIDELENHVTQHEMAG